MIIFFWTSDGMAIGHGDGGNLGLDPVEFFKCHALPRGERDCRYRRFIARLLLT